MLHPSQHLLMPEPHGQIVNPSKKSEINLLVDLVGLSELLKLCPIDSVLLLDKKIKPEFPQKIYYLVVLHVEVDVVEVIHQLLGLIIKTLDLLPEIFMEIPNIVKLMLSHHVPIILTPPNTQIAQPLNITPHHVNKHVTPHQEEHTLLINITDLQLILFQESLKSNKIS